MPDTATIDQLKLDGNALYHKAEYAAAIIKYSEAITKKPEDHDLVVLYTNRAACNLALQQFLAALEDVKLDPESVKGWLRTAYAAEALGGLLPLHWDTARTACEKGKATLETAGSPSAQRQTIDLMFDAILERVNASQRRDAELHAANKSTDSASATPSVIISELRAEGRPPSERALQLKADADTFHRQKKYSSAYEKYSEAIAEKPGDGFLAVLYSNRAATCMSMQRYLDALSDAQHSTRLNPSYSKAWHRIFSAAEALGFWQTMCEAGTKVLAHLVNEDASVAAYDSVKSGIEIRLQTAMEKQANSWPWLVAASLCIQKQLLWVPSSAWVLAIAFNFMTQGEKAMKSTVINVSDFPTHIPGGVGIMAESTMPGRALEDFTNAITYEPRIWRVEPEFLERLEIQMGIEAQRDEMWRTVDAQQIKREFTSLISRESWTRMRAKWATTVRTWIMNAFLDSKKGNHESAGTHYKRAIDMLEWGAAKYAGVAKQVRGAVFEPSFIRGVRRLYLPTLVARYEQVGPLCGHTVEDIINLARSLKSDTEAAAAKWTDEEKAQRPGDYAGFLMYPAAEAMCHLAWAQKQLAKRHLPRSEEYQAMMGEASSFYLRAANAFPPDDEQRIFIVYEALEIAFELKFRLLACLNLCRRMEDMMEKVNVVWGHARVSVEAEQKAAQCQRAVEWFHDCEKRIREGNLSETDVEVPSFSRVYA
ncbi:TPR-REGION domain-containing protein [Mycena kentingensis (nom. inval.)]|nr:TPR-REGION domain-containing protein [Mycena kentingensis (nom. inval.)]